jgi:hypothetical protein
MPRRIRDVPKEIAPHDRVDVALVGNVTITITNDRATPVYVVAKL